MDEENDGTLAGSTGKNDSSSVWGSGLLGTLKGWTDAAGSIYNSVSSDKKKPTIPAGAASASPVTTATQPASSSSWTKYLPWAAGGVVLLVVVVFVFRRK